LYLNNLSVAQIKFLNNLLLAILLKNFRWLKIRLHDILNNSSIVQGVIVCLTLFNLQGTVAVAFAVSLLILSRSFPFVKNFFLLFSNFFELISYQAPSSRRLAYISIYTPFCQVVFYDFFQFFRSLF